MTTISQPNTGRTDGSVAVSATFLPSRRYHASLAGFLALLFAFWVWVVPGTKVEWVQWMSGPMAVGLLYLLVVEGYVLLLRPPFLIIDDCGVTWANRLGRSYQLHWQEITEVRQEPWPPSWRIVLLVKDRGQVAARLGWWRYFWNWSASLGGSSPFWIHGAMLDATSDAVLMALEAGLAQRSRPKEDADGGPSVVSPG